MNTLVLTTDRLLLRSFAIDDAPDVERLVGDWEVAKTTLNIPNPYEDGMAEDWISSSAVRLEKGRAVIRALTLEKDSSLIGAIELSIEERQERAVMGYWVGHPYWGRGYCTEAAGALVDHGFRGLGLNRIEATHLIGNPASGRVMQKIGMTKEGTLRSYAKRDGGDFGDYVMYSILRHEFERSQRDQ